MEAKELEAVRIEEENALNLNSNSNLLSVLSARPYEGKEINLSSSDIEADSWRLMSLTGLFNLAATGICQLSWGKKTSMRQY